MATNSTSGAAPAKVETVTLRQLAEGLSESHELPKKQVMGMLEEMVGDITKHLKRGARIRIGGLGILQVRKRPARMGRNPATGEAIKIKASKKVAFRAAKELKESDLTRSAGRRLQTWPLNPPCAGGFNCCGKRCTARRRRAATSAASAPPAA